MTAPSTTRPIHQPGVRRTVPAGTLFGMTAGCVCCSFVGPGSTRGAAYCRSNSAPQSGQRTTASSISFPHFGHIIRAHPFREQTSAQDRVLTGEQAGLCEHGKHDGAEHNGAERNGGNPPNCGAPAAPSDRDCFQDDVCRRKGGLRSAAGHHDGRILHVQLHAAVRAPDNALFEVLSAFRTHHRNPFPFC